MVFFLTKLFLYGLIVISSLAAASLRINAFKKVLLPNNIRSPIVRQERSLPDLIGIGKTKQNQRRSIEQRLPKVLLIGVRKSGTRALLEFLNLHPLIAAASDEVHFFDNDTLFEQGLDAYRKAMPFTFEDQLTIEKTPAYFSRSIVPGRVKQLGLDLKFIVVFRDPVTRTISDYTQVLSNRRLRNVTFPPFEHVAFRKKRSANLPNLKDPEVNARYKAINISTYAYHMNNWLQYFPLEKFHFVDGDRLVSNPIVELRDVERFLGLPHAIGSDLLYFNKTRGFYCMKVPHPDNEDDEQESAISDQINLQDDRATAAAVINWSGVHFKNKCLRPDKGRQHPVIAGQFVEQLRRYFRPLNELLFQTIHKRFDWP